MREDNLIRFDVRILGRMIPIKIQERQQEETERLIKEINGKLADFQLKYKNVDKVDSLIMVLLSYVFDRKGNDDDNLKEQLLNKMKALGEQLEE